MVDGRQAWPAIPHLYAIPLSCTDCFVCPVSSDTGVVHAEKPVVPSFTSRCPVRVLTLDAFKLNPPTIVGVSARDDLRLTQSPCNGDVTLDNCLAQDVASNVSPESASPTSLASANLADFPFCASLREATTLKELADELLRQNKPHLALSKYSAALSSLTDTRQNVVASHASTVHVTHETTSSTTDDDSRTLRHDILINQACALTCRGMYDDAVRSAWEAKSLKPDSAVCFYRISEALFRLGRYSDAVDAASEGVMRCISGSVEHSLLVSTRQKSLEYLKAFQFAYNYTPSRVLQMPLQPLLDVPWFFDPSDLSGETHDGFSNLLSRGDRSSLDQPVSLDFMSEETTEALSEGADVNVSNTCENNDDQVDHRHQGEQSPNASNSTLCCFPKCFTKFFLTNLW